MNTENIRALAARLRSPSVEGHFYMGDWYRGRTTMKPTSQELHQCGTTACIAGFAAAMARPQNVIPLEDTKIIATDWLGLNYTEASKLFFRVSDGAGHDTTAEEAAATLDHLADTGEVVWS